MNISADQLWKELWEGLRQTSLLEGVAVLTGIASVLFSRLENILVYPVGMINTSIFIYLYLSHGLYADAAVNGYYTLMSIWGWRNWSRRTREGGRLQITRSTRRQWVESFVFFITCWAGLFFVLRYLTDSTVPLADAFTSGAAFTGMWLMNRKKLENWSWWILTNLASIPLNFYKHLVFSSFQYLVFLVLAILGYISWSKKCKPFAR